MDSALVQGGLFVVGAENLCGLCFFMIPIHLHVVQYLKIMKTMVDWHLIGLGSGLSSFRKLCFGGPRVFVSSHLGVQGGGSLARSRDANTDIS